MLLGEKNLSHLRDFGIPVGSNPTQRSPFGPGEARGTQKTRCAQGRRTGLISAAPPALRKGKRRNIWD